MATTDPADLARRIGGQIRKARLDMPYENGRHISQATLARKLGTTNVTVARWEAGTHIPELTTLMTLVEVTGKPVSYFYSEGEAAA